MQGVFSNKETDNNIFIVTADKKYSFSDIRKIISARLETVKEKKKNVVLFGEDTFYFIINFFAAIYAKKNIYLLSDRKKLQDLNIEYDILEDKFKEEFSGKDLPEITPENTKIIFFTSGSSGLPKSITKSLYNLIKEGCDLGEELKIQDKDLTIMSTTTMTHLFGLTFHLMFSLCNGFKIYTERINYPENAESDNAILISTPAFLNSVKKHNLQFNKLPKYIFSAGSKLDEDVFKFLEKDSNVVEIYGSTETGVIAYKTHYNNSFTIFPNVNIAAGENSTTIISEYIYEGKTSINDEVEIVGNHLYIKKRTDRLFKISDKRISAEELEQELNKHKFVQNSYIIKHEEKLACLCVLSQEGKDFILRDGVSDLTKILKTYLFKYSEIIPQKWKYTDELPMNKTGKIDKCYIEHLFNINLSFPIILDRRVDENSIEYEILFYKNCNFFNGHFPQFKLLPGVVQLYYAKEFASHYFGMALGEGQWKRIKFSNIILPDSPITLKLSKSETSVMYEYYDINKKYSSGSFPIQNVFKE